MKTKKHNNVTMAHITANYSTCCFCDKPQLPCGVPHNSDERGSFKKAAIKYANIHGLYIIKASSKNHYAIAQSPCRCRHGQNYVRLERHLYYDD